MGSAWRDPAFLELPPCHHWSLMPDGMPSCWHPWQLVPVPKAFSSPRGDTDPCGEVTMQSRQQLPVTASPGMLLA